VLCINNMDYLTASKVNIYGFDDVLIMVLDRCAFLCCSGFRLLGVRV
jgi:hypothetical protein